MIGMLMCQQNGVDIPGVHVKRRETELKLSYGKSTVHQNGGIVVVYNGSVALTTTAQGC